jgi:superfamily II DNA or RNA helicase
MLRTILSQLEQTTEVPSGLVPLVDPDFRAQVSPDPTPGGIVSVGRQQFHAMPVNERQPQVIANVDSHAQTLVQGPPGTGKTHTAAALLTHLLGQGKRVLVTTQTDRALKEVRDKLPAAIRPLAVSVVGRSLGRFPQPTDPPMRRMESRC